MIVVQDKVKIPSVRDLVCNMKRLFSVLFFEQLQQNNDFLRNNLKLIFAKIASCKSFIPNPINLIQHLRKKHRATYSFLFSSVQFLEKGCSLEFTHKTANITYLAWLFPRAGHQKTICKQQQQQQQQHRKGKQVIQISKIYCPWKQENAQFCKCKKRLSNKQTKYYQFIGNHLEKQTTTKEKQGPQESNSVLHI